MRYPRAGKGAKWTIKELEAIPAVWRGESLSDGDGLSGQVRVADDSTVSVVFRFGFKWEGRKAWSYCGAWPTVSLAEIRNRRDTARQQIRSGVNPSQQRQVDRIEAQARVEAVIAKAEKAQADQADVQDLFDAWLADGVNRSDGNAELRRSFQKDVLPLIGDRQVRTVVEGDVLRVLRQIVGRGVNRMATRVHLDLIQMFGWAEKRKPWRALLADGNPAALIKMETVLPVDAELASERDRVLAPKELQELATIFRTAEVDYANTPAGKKYSAVRPLQRESQLAMWIALGTLCRIGELLMAEWRHVDLERGVWFIPKEATKRIRGGRRDHTVCLSDFTRRQVKALKEITGQTRWCFPASSKEDQHVCVKSVAKQIGDRQCRFKKRTKLLKHRRNDNSLVLAKGASGEWTPHDMRRTGATMMQGLRISPEVIDRCQNHVLGGSKIRRHYLHHDYSEEKREAWRLLGKRVDVITGHVAGVRAARTFHPVPEEFEQ